MLSLVVRLPPIPFEVKILFKTRFAHMKEQIKAVPEKRIDYAVPIWLRLWLKGLYAEPFK
jgi:hypothetical protein